ncbi:ARI5A protein, partial [Bucco capensis]|nr:ARI5A protein [Bucco capensis]
MSPLAKKKLLAQVSEAESMHCLKRHCPEGQWAVSITSHSPEPPRPAASPHLDEQSSPEPSGAQDPAPRLRSEVGTIPNGRENQPRAGGPAPPVFTGCFHTYRSEVPKPGGCHPLWGCFSSLKEFLEPPFPFPASRAEEPEQPRALRHRAGQLRSRESWPEAPRGCWVVPTVPRGERAQEEEEEDDDDDEEEEEEEEEVFGPHAELGAISPSGPEAEGRPAGAGLHSHLAKPKAVVASTGYSCPDVYKGVLLHFPASFGNPLEHLRTQGVPVPPALSLNPFIIPAFPSPLLASSPQPSELCPGHYALASPRHRLYPAGTWHSHTTSSSPHLSAFQRHGKL